MFLEAHFGEVELHMPDDPSPDRVVKRTDGVGNNNDEEEEKEEEDAPGLLVAVDETEAFINLASMVSLSFGI